jgi:hypothetical protein
MKKAQARMFHELPSRGRGEARATGQPQGVGFEAYLNSTSQGEPVLSEVEGTPEDARKDGHIIRARCASLSPASGSQFRGRSRPFMKHPG